MSIIGKNVNTYLQTKTAVADIAGSRGYPGNLPVNATLPAYTYQIISGNGDQHLQGMSGYAVSRVQIDCYGDAPADAASLRNAIYSALLIHPAPLMDSVEVDRVSHANTFERTEKPNDGSDSWRYRRSDDYLIQHAELIPS